MCRWSPTMMIRRDMKSSLLVILILNACCVFSQRKTAHDAFYFVGCFENGTTEVQFELDTEEVFYVDFKREEVVYTMPKFVVEDPSQIFEIHHLYRNAARAKGLCPLAVVFIKAEEKNPPEERDAPESILYPADGLQLGVENTLICFVNHFYPPDIRVSWTKNGHPVSEGLSLSRYFLNKDQTFHQFSTLTFTPREEDVYSCTVEHLALARPLTRMWEPEFTHPSPVPDIFCGVGLTLGLLGVAAGTVLLVKGHHGQ
ncbi:H-2 class II histocompatibility antigen, A-U alpha chain-like [Acanthopagrus schlegelii]